MAISIIQAPGQQLTGGTTSSLAYSSSVTAGNLLVGFGWTQVAVGGTVTVADSFSNVWTVIVVNMTGFSNNGFLCYYIGNTNSGACTVTATNSPVTASNKNLSCIAEINASGGGTWGFDLSASSQQSTTSTSYTGPALTTTHNSEIVCTCFTGYQTQALGGSISAPFSFFSPGGAGVASNYCFAAYDIASSTGTFQATITSATGANAWTTIIAGFYTIGGAPGGGGAGGYLNRSAQEHRKFII